jgi:hypothetical protein
MLSINRQQTETAVTIKSVGAALMPLRQSPTFPKEKKKSPATVTRSLMDSIK